MPPTSTSQASENVGNVVDYLHRAGEKYKERVELLRKQRDIKELQGLTFKPTVTRYAEEAHRQSIERHSQTIEERLHQLHGKRLMREAQLRAQREQQEEAEASSFTYHPKVTAQAARMSRADVPSTSAQWLAARDARLAKLHESVLYEEMKELRSTPHITAYAHEKALAERPANVPVEDFLVLQGELRRRRQYARAERQNQWTSANAHCNNNNAVTGRSRSTSRRGASPPQQKAFTPSISAYAAQLPSAQGDVVERLYSSAATDTSGEQTGPQSAMPADHTFQPKISDFSRELSKVYYCDPTVADKSVYERLYENPQYKSKYRSKAELETHHKQPRTLSRASRATRSSSASTVGEESPTSRLHRTSIGNISDAGRSCSKEASSTSHPPAETFHPQINERSDAMWRRSVQMLMGDGVARNATEARELLWRQAQRRKEDEVRREALLRHVDDMKECTFQPKVSRAPRGRPGYDATMTVAERGALWRKQRERRLEELRSELHSSTAAEHSFKPHIHPVFPLPRHAEPAAGEDVFVERLEEARRRKEEAERWWQPRSSASRGSRSTSMSTARSSVANSETASRFQPHYPAASSQSYSPMDERLYDTPSQHGTEFIVHHNRPAQPVNSELPYRAVYSREAIELR